MCSGAFAKPAGVACTSPITAAFAAFEALRRRRLAPLTPYRDDIDFLMRDDIEAPVTRSLRLTSWAI